jgi:hypothetical protein
MRLLPVSHSILTSPTPTPTPWRAFTHSHLSLSHHSRPRSGSMAATCSMCSFRKTTSASFRARSSWW